MSDTQGHQLPNVIYPGILDRAEMVDWVERFYGEYYFRPKAAWRIVRKAMFNSNDRRRLYKEAKSYLSLRHKRQKYVADYQGRRRGLHQGAALKEAALNEAGTQALKTGLVVNAGA